MKAPKYFICILLSVVPFLTIGQKNNAVIIKNLDVIQTSTPGVSNFWLEMGVNTYGYPMLMPVIVIKGSSSGSTLGLTAGIHGNELNGIPIIHELLENIDFKKLKGTIIAIPGLNVFSIQVDERRFIDEEDLNRNFPGKKNGNRSQQYVSKINELILPSFDFMIDMHTASFGRINTMYARADLKNDTLKLLAKLQQPDIILNSIGASTANGAVSSPRTMRAEAVLKGIPCITVEYGNPQVFQKELTERGLKGIMNTLNALEMYGNNKHKELVDKATYCKKSYWIYMNEGGFLEVPVELNQRIQKGDKIGIVKDAFGNILNEYLAPEDGIVIGKSTNPSNMSGGRIIHLGIMY
ncbi:MAG: succinylglutamate desuccinylase/aspartoacylase family protein [Cyclobacteriaceae bacterium]|nr:succinylglutamate desuccinylase/aspartoacylase family protein [Cyclobacteriaceae bacterium]